MFSWATQEQLISLCSQGAIREIPRGTLLISQGSLGEELFVLLKGELEVLKTPEGSAEELVVERYFTPGDSVGEAASLTDDGLRTATVRCASDSQLLAISFQQIKELDGSSAFYRASAKAAAGHQAHDALVGESRLFKKLTSAGPLQGWSQEEAYQDGEVVFSQGSPPGRAHFILAGQAEISLERGGSSQHLGLLSSGQIFGELSIIRGEPRLASVTARGELRTLAIDPDRFLQLAGRSKEAAEHLRVLRQVYGDRQGGATLQFDEEVDGRPVIVTVLQDPEEGPVLVQYAIGSLQTRIERELPDLPRRSVEYEDEARGITRTLSLAGAKISHALLIGPSDETGKIVEAVREQREFDLEDFAHFKDTGLLFGEGAAPDLACHCLRISHQTLQRSVERGCDSAEALARATGASTVCGDCRSSLEALAGELSLVRAKIYEREQLTEDVYRIRFTPSEGASFSSSTPGQHIVVEGVLSGVKVRRPYTLTSTGPEQAWREITIRREAHGLFSRWLCDVDPDVAELAITAPSGSFIAELEDADPLLMLVAGIGVTPAIAVARARAAMTAGSPVVIDHSAQTQEHLVSEAELRDLAEATPGLRYRTRKTAGGERLNHKEIQALHREHPTARWMICGPEAFQVFAQESAIKAGASPAKVKIERFGPTSAAASAALPKDRISLLLALASTSLALIGLWTHLGPASFYQWQASPPGRWWTGGAMALYLAYQWTLPIYRWAGNRRGTESLRSWHRRVGAIAPLLLLFHGDSFGAGMLSLLTVVIIANTIVGVADRSLIKDERAQRAYLSAWLYPHIILSALLTTLAIFHVWTILAHGGP